LTRCVRSDRSVPWVAAFVFVGGLGLASIAQANEPSLPVLVFEAPAVYPNSALEEGEEATVLLELELTARGRVRAARLIDEAESEFGEAALQAAWSFVFEPATDGQGRPVPATIRYAYVFALTRAPVVSLSGCVFEAGVKRSLIGEEVRLVGKSGGDRRVRTGEDGCFEVADLAPGAWRVLVEPKGFRAEVADVEVLEGQRVEVTLYPVQVRPWEDERADQEIVVTARREVPQITERVLDAETIRYLPGTNGDVVRVVQNLPGVARPPLNIGQLIIRGMAPDDSGYTLDGGRIPLVFHFAGFSTVINGDALKEVAFLPGGYGVRYGRTLGGLVDLRTRNELTEKSRGIAEVDLFQTSIFVEQRVSEKASLTVSGRRSYADAILNPLLSKGSSTIRAPRYYDGLVRYAHKTSAGMWDALILFSDDSFRFIGTESDEEAVQLAYSTSFQKMRLRSDLIAGKGWRVETSLIAGPERRGFGIAPAGEAREETWAGGLRHEWLRKRADGPIGIRVGLDAAATQFAFLYDVPDFGVREEGSIVAFMPGGYGEVTTGWKTGEIITGIRADAIFDENDYQTQTLDPRVGFRQEFAAQMRVKGNVGRYSQFPLAREVQPPPDGVGNPDLQAERALQTSLGVEAAQGTRWVVEGTGFYHHLTGLVVGREDAFRFFTGPPPAGPLDARPYANEGVGRTYGVETLVKYTDDRTLAWLAATWSRSFRQDREDEPEELLRYDQPVVLTALGSRELPKRWRIGARVRYGSGNPYTKVVNRVYDLDRRTFTPIFGPVDAERLPSFFSLDLRVDKDYVYRLWTLTTYFDIQNATAAKNLELMSWTYDYEQEDPVTTPPPLPTFGFRAKW
jgi:TonB family protein